MKIEIKNFLKMTPEVPEYSSKNQHYYMSGVNPTYYLDTSGTQEEQYAPLAASKAPTLISGALDGYLVNMVSSPDTTNYSAFGISSNTKVWGLNTSVATNLGFPSGVAVGNVGGRLAVFNGNIIATWSTTGSFYRTPVASPGTWTSFGIKNTAIGVCFMEPFLDFVAYHDGTTSFTQGSLVRKFDSSFVFSNGIDLGLGMAVLGMRNLNNKYLAVAGGAVTAGSLNNSYDQNYVFLWDGIAARYNYAIRIPGIYMDMKVVDGVLYIAVLLASKKTAVYKLEGTRLKKIFTTQFSTITNSTIPLSQALFNYKSYLGIEMDNFTLPNSTVNYHTLLVYGNEEEGLSEFNIYNFPNSSGGNSFFNSFVTGGDAELYLADNVTSIYYLNTLNTAYNQITYISQWIPVENLASIDIYHSTPPQSGSDKISVTLYGVGEDIITGSATFPLTDITPLNFTTSRRTKLDCQGFTGDKVKILLTTTNTTWQPIIRKIILTDEK